MKKLKEIKFMVGKTVNWNTRKSQKHIVCNNFLQAVYVYIFHRNYFISPF